jgi:hypothetical protein
VAPLARVGAGVKDLLPWTVDALQHVIATQQAKLDRLNAEAWGAAAMICALRELVADLREDLATAKQDATSGD